MRQEPTFDPKRQAGTGLTGANQPPAGARLGKLRAFTQPEEHSPVTMLELFFDLVFVFGATQVSSLMQSGTGIVGYGQAALVLLLTWWIYLGYVWLANNVPPTTVGTRIPMLVAMGCFLAMGVWTRSAFDDGGFLFAGAYFVLTVIHSILFARSSLGSSARAIRSVAPVNIGISALLFLAALVGPNWGWIAWAAAVLLGLISLAIRRRETFTLRPIHFAERHALLIIIALGETILSLGTSAEGALEEPLIAITSALVFGVVCALWWIYFGTTDQEKALQAVQAISGNQLTSTASKAYTRTHLLHVAGLVLIAVGFHDVLHDPSHQLSLLPSCGFAAGFVLYFWGQAQFRSTLKFAPTRPFAFGTAVCLASIPAAMATSALTQTLILTLTTTALAIYLTRARAATQNSQAAASRSPR